MGIFSQRDVFSNKWITAMITDVNNRLHIVPIKDMISEDLFFLTIKKKLYCFKIDPARIKIYYQTAVKSCRVLFYDTNHYLPLSPADIKECEIILRKNSLPRVNKRLMDIFKLLGKREKTHDPDKPFTFHDIVALMDENKKSKGEYNQEFEEMAEYLQEHLNVDKIVTPVRKLSDFLDYEIKLTDPTFADMILSRADKTERENKKITNQESTGKRPWIMMIAILGVVAIVIGVIVWGVQTGAFNNMIPGFGGGGGFSSPFGSFGGSQAGGQLTSSSPISEWVAKYPTPQSIQDGINSHAISCTDLPKQVHDMVDTLKPKPCP